jgi:osmoprotectant transport system substrate-binding protein
VGGVIPTGRVLRTMVAAAVGVLLGLGMPVASAVQPGGERTPTPMVVGAYDFPEGRIMAELYAGVLRHAGQPARVVTVRNREEMGPRLRAGSVQVVPEYLGSFAEYLNVRANGPDARPVGSNDRARPLGKARALGSPVGLSVLTPARAQNVNAFAVRAAFAAENGVETLSDLAAWSQTHPLRLAGPPECPRRPFCLPGLERVYGMRVAQFVATDTAGPLTRAAIDTGAVDVGVLFSTDGSVADLGFIVLRDDRRLQNVDNLVPVIRRDARNPMVVAALNRLSAVLTTGDLVLMNKAVALDRRSPRRVAAEYLAARGL